MGVHQLPGVMCAFTNALPSDAGTLVVGASQPPGASGRDADATTLEQDEREWIRRTYGRKADGTPMELSSLRFYHDQSIDELRSAVRRYGAQSKQARWHEAVVAQFAAVIDEVQARRKSAAAKLHNVVNASGGRVGDNEKSAIKAAIVDAFKEAKQDADAGRHDAVVESMDGVTEAFQALHRADKAGLADLIAKARVPGSQVTEADLQKALVQVLSDERQKQLLGIPDAPGEADVGALMGDALVISTQMRKEKLRRALEGKKSNQEIQEALAGVLGGERQKQLMGVTDDAEDASTSALMTEALDTFQQRSKLALAGVLEAAKNGSMSKEQIGKAIADVLGVERQRQLLGVSDGTDQELSQLLDEASVAYRRAKAKPTNRGAKSPNRMLMEPIMIKGRVIGRDPER